MGDKNENDENIFFKQFVDYFLIKPVKQEKMLVLCYEIFVKKTHISKNLIKISDSNDKIIDIKILIDDDIHLNKILLKTLLNKLGFYNIKTVNDGQQAVDALKIESFDICLIDIKTPKLTGYDVISEIKKYKKKPYCIAIITTPHNNHEYYKSHGFDDILIKPVDSIGIGKLISSYMKFKKTIK
jgi:two-component system CheB/CheR fusion protein